MIRAITPDCQSALLSKRTWTGFIAGVLLIAGAVHAQAIPHVHDSRAALPPGRGAAMDYGPFLTYSVLRPSPELLSGGKSKVHPEPRVTTGRPSPEKTDGGELLATRGITIRVGNDAYVCFDTDTLALAGGWTGKFLDVSHSHLDRDKGELPAIAGGPLLFSTHGTPGWSLHDSNFKDTRPEDGGPLPESLAHYKGLYRNGNQVVLSYTVDGADVLEQEGSVVEASHLAITRTVHIGRTQNAVRMNLGEADATNTDGHLITYDLKPCTGPHCGAPETSIADLSDGTSHRLVAVVGAPPGSALRVLDNFRIALTLGATETGGTFKIVMATLSNADIAAFPALVKAAGAPQDPSPLCKGGASLWPEKVEVSGIRAPDKAAYVVDTAPLPENNPWKSWIRPSGFDFFPDGRVAMCTWNGDVWIGQGLDDSLSHITWKRFAAGLYDTLGLKIINNEIYVLGRDQITRLHDLNGDGEADFYENFCNSWPLSAIYHAFNLDLQADSKGALYFTTCGNHALTWMRMKGNVIRVSPDGKTVDTIGWGLRAPNGLGIGPKDEILTTDNQGNWIPADRINIMKPAGFYGFPYDPNRLPKGQTHDKPEKFDLPLCYLRYPNLDNSAGTVIYAGDKWGPLSGHLLCTSFGKSSLIAVLTEEADGIPQAACYRIPLKFESGIMRARIGPKDGQVWVSGLGGWQTNTVHEGCLQRVRYTGKKYNLPTDFHILANGISITFSDPLDSQFAVDDQSYGIEQWNYIWTSKYGSPEVKLSDPKAQGHDTVAVKKATLSADKKTVTLETGHLSPVMQMAIEMHLRSADGTDIECEIDNTINQVPAK